MILHLYVVAVQFRSTYVVRTYVHAIWLTAVLAYYYTSRPMILRFQDSACTFPARLALSPSCSPASSVRARLGPCQEGLRYKEIVSSLPSLL